MKEPENTFLNLLKEKGYSFNFFINHIDLGCGMLPDGFEEIGYHGVKISDDVQKNYGNDLSYREMIGYFGNDLTIQEYLKEWEIEDDSFSFFLFADYHLAINDLDSAGIEEGSKRLEHCLDLIFKKYSKDEFDQIIIFSDHGHYMGKSQGAGIVPDLLDRNRTQICMQIRYKGENNIKFDDNLRSIMDVCPTIYQKLGYDIPNWVDGISFDSTRGHEYLLIEDHDRFSLNPGMTLEYWAVVNKKGIFVQYLDAIWRQVEGNEPLTKEEEQFYICELENKMSFYIENTRYYKLISLYGKYNQTLNYSDGSPRFKLEIKLTVLEKIKKKIFHTLKHFIGQIFHFI